MRPVSRSAASVPPPGQPESLTSAPPPGQGESLAPYGWMLAGAAAFAVMGSCAHGLRDDVPWELVALSRTGGVLILTLLAAWLGGVRLVWNSPPSLWLRSLSGSVTVLCTFNALTHAPVADVLTLTNMFPLWVALLSWPLLGLRPTGGVWASLVCSLAGIVLIQRPHFAEGNSALSLALVSSLTTAFAMLGLHRLKHIDPRAVVVHFSAVSLVFCLAAPVLSGTSIPSAAARLEGSHWLLLGGTALAATLGQLFLTMAYAAGPPARIAVVGLTQVFFGLVLDAAISRRAFAPETLFGMALIVAPTAWLLIRRAGDKPPTVPTPVADSPDPVAETPARP